MFTTRKRSCGKVMFSQASVCAGGIGTSHVLWETWVPPLLDIILEHLPHLPKPRHQTWAPPTPSYWHLVVITVDVLTWGPTPTVVTSSGGHWKRYSWQKGSMHPARMLSCYQLQGKVIFSQALVILYIGEGVWCHFLSLVLWSVLGVYSIPWSILGGCVVCPRGVCLVFCKTIKRRGSKQGCTQNH